MAQCVGSGAGQPEFVHGSSIWELVALGKLLNLPVPFSHPQSGTLLAPACVAYVGIMQNIENKSW